MAFGSMARQLGLAAMLVCAAAAVAGDGLVRNGGFEAGHGGWTLRGGALVVEDGGPVREGRRALRFALGGRRAAAQVASQRVAVTADRAYVLSFWVFTRALFPAERFRLGVRQFSARNGLGPLSVAGQPCFFIGRHPKWEQIRVRLHGLDRRATHLGLAFETLPGTAGDAWIDDVRLEPLDECWLSISTAKPVNLFTDGEPIRGTIVVHGPARPASGELRYRVKDFWGRSVVAQRKQLAVRAQGKAEVPFEFRGLGYFEVNAEFSEAGRRASAVTESIGVLPAAAPRAACPDPRSPFGAWVGGTDYMPAIGVKWTRFILAWELLEPQAGTLDVEWYRRAIRAARQKGLEVFISFHRTARWASAAPAASADFHLHPPRQWDDWARFVRRVVRELKDDVWVWEVCNEPVIPWGWKGTPAELVDLHRVAYQAIKAEQPNAVVIGPCYGPIGATDQVRELFRAGLGRWIDGVAHHPYAKPESIPPEQCGYLLDLLALRAMTRAFGREKALWLTEIGWFADPSAGFGEHDQANVLARACLLSVAAGVRLANWHSMVEGKLWDPHGGTGLLRAVLPARPLAPRPAYIAYGTVARTLTGAACRQELDWLGGTRTGYVFEKQARPILALWDWGGGSDVELAIGATEAVVIDLMSTRRHVAAPGGRLRLTLSQSPVFVLGGTADALLKRTLQVLRFEPRAVAVRAGGQLAFRITVANPLGKTLRGTLEVVAPADWQQRLSLPLALAPGDTAEHAVRLSVARDALNGTRLIATRVVAGGRTIARRVLVVEVTGSERPSRDNRIANPSFELGSARWYVKPGADMGHKTTDQSLTGLHAWEMGPGREAYLVGHCGPVRPGKRYRISVWVRAHNVTRDGAAHIQIQRWTKNGKPGPFYVKNGADRFCATRGTTDWVERSFDVTDLPSDTGHFTLYLRRDAGQGTVWWDAVDVVEE